MNFKWLSSASKEEIRWFFNHLVMCGFVKNAVGNDSQKSRTEKVKEYFLQLHQRNPIQAEQEVNSLLSLKSHLGLDDADFNWLDEQDSFQSIYIWGAARSLSITDYAGYLVIPEAKDNFNFNVSFNPANATEYLPFYKYIGNVYPKDERFMSEIFKDFFQRWPLHADNKRLILRQIKDKYEELKHYGNAMGWLSMGDQEAFRWAWLYMQDREVPTEYLLGNEFNATLDHLVTAFDLWNAHKAEKELFYRRMKTADSQRRTRMRRKNRKPYQVFLTKEHKEKLDELAWHYDRKIYEVVEELISKEYRRTKENS
ncbi:MULTISPECIES: hypothetical protein [Idiomarina]|jgi:hypothetical protein|uniref:hypothetical protein n=1 Tax=Idiomarina TaxID=135575 RepID=UPI000C390751|nr:MULTISPECIES: hypothetical protein [Idiomarina]MAO66808.1 hypothetical protein [Idiomarina sp.]MBF79957.1 hypothetical protein [Idiomarina sp.]|tara:strand:- start:974 stop:1909 length:936 start_codon:yes stop_codon:yes gene_type:complete